MDRNQRILATRDELPITATAQMGAEQQFAFTTLRPILMAQNDLFLAVFKNYVTRHKSEFFDYTPEKQSQFIENAIHKDIKFRNALKGMVIGWFTLDEYHLYIQNSSSLNKRMMNLLIERLQSQLLIFAQGSAI